MDSPTNGSAYAASRRTSSSTENSFPFGFFLLFTASQSFNYSSIGRIVRAFLIEEQKIVKKVLKASKEQK